MKSWDWSIERLNEDTYRKKAQVGNNQERRNQKEISTPKTELGKINLSIRYLYLENIK